MNNPNNNLPNTNNPNQNFNPQNNNQLGMRQPMGFGGQNVQGNNQNQPTININPQDTNTNTQNTNTTPQQNSNPNQMGQFNQMNPQQQAFMQQQQMMHQQAMMQQQMNMNQWNRGQPGQPGNFNQPGFQQPGMMGNQGMGGQPNNNMGLNNQQMGALGNNLLGGPKNPNLLNDKNVLDPTGQGRINASDNKGLQNISEARSGAYETSQETYGRCIGWMGTWCCIGCCPNPYKLIPEGFTGIVVRFGKFHQLLPPGMHFVNPDIDALELIDKREKTVDLRRQQVVTRDNMSLFIDAVLFYRIFDSYKSRFAVTNLELSLRDLATTAMRNVVGVMTMQEFLEKREELDDQIQLTIKGPAANWGCKITRVQIQDVQLPNEFRNTMSSSAIQKKIGEAKLIAAQADVDAARLMRDAADALSTQAALQIRYLDALELLAKTGNPKMVFFPADYRDIGSSNDHLDGLIDREFAKQ